MATAFGWEGRGERIREPGNLPAVVREDVTSLADNT